MLVSDLGCVMIYLLTAIGLSPGGSIITWWQ